MPHRELTIDALQCAQLLNPPAKMLISLAKAECILNGVGSMPSNDIDEVLVVVVKLSDLKAAQFQRADQLIAHQQGQAKVGMIDWPIVMRLIVDWYGRILL